jgi:hypothetical protein
MRPPRKPRPRCIICGKTKNLELNHVGGRKHLAWFMMWFCQSHHRKFHAQLFQAGVDLTYTPNPDERYNRAMRALAICLLMIAEAQREAFSSNARRCKHGQ